MLHLYSGCSWVGPTRWVSVPGGYLAGFGPGVLSKPYVDPTRLILQRVWVRVWASPLIDGPTHGYPKKKNKTLIFLSLFFSMCIFCLFIRSSCSPTVTLYIISSNMK